MHSFGAELLEARVESFARLAKLDIVAVAEGKNGKFEVLEARSGSIFQVIPKCLGIVGHFTVAIGARDDRNPLFLAEIDCRVALHSHDPRFETLRLGILCEPLRETLGTPGLRAKQEQ